MKAMSDTKYQVKRFCVDPFDIMCGEGPEHEIEWWEDTTLEELRKDHAEEVAMDAFIPDQEAEYMRQNGWNPTTSDFDEWLKQSIADGYIRPVA